MHRTRFYLAIGCAAALTLLPTAFAQTMDEAAQAFSRAQASVNLLAQNPNLQSARASFQLAQSSLDDARAAQDRRDYRETIWRSDEAVLNAEVALAEIAQNNAQRRAQELSQAVAALEREAKAPAPVATPPLGQTSAPSVARPPDVVQSPRSGSGLGGTTQ